MGEPDYTTFERAKAEKAKGIELGCTPDAIRFTPTNEATFYYALGVLPPVTYGENCLLMGEANSHNDRGEAVYYGFFHYPKTKAYACALMTERQFRDTWGYVMDAIEQKVTGGDCVKNIESGWRGIVQAIEKQDGEQMLVCLGVNWWTGEIDSDDKQWHSAKDVVKCERVSKDPPNALNFL